MRSRLSSSADHIGSIPSAIWSSPKLCKLRVGPDTCIGFLQGVAGPTRLAAKQKPNNPSQKKVCAADATMAAQLAVSQSMTAPLCQRLARFGPIRSVGLWKSVRLHHLPKEQVSRNSARFRSGPWLALCILCVVIERSGQAASRRARGV